MANLVAARSAIRASRATLTASRAERRSTAAGLSAADLARAARSSWAFFEFAAALRRSAKLVFLGPFISILYAQGKAAPKGGVRFLLKNSGVAVERFRVLANRSEAFRRADYRPDPRRQPGARAARADALVQPGHTPVLTRRI